MPRDIRPTEVETDYSEKVTHTIHIKHKETGLSVKGKGPNKFALECQLLDKLREKLDAKDRTDEVMK